MHNQIKRMNKYVSVSNVSPTIIAFFNITAAMMVLMMLRLDTLRSSLAVIERGMVLDEYVWVKAGNVRHL